MKRKFSRLLLLAVFCMMASLFSMSNTAMATQTADTTVDFTERASEITQMISDAKAQVQAKDYTPLSDPVEYKMLWLGYTHVTYGELDYRMTDFHKEYLRSVALNFEKVVEEYANHNIDIEIDLYFVDNATELTYNQNSDWLYLKQETIQSDINQYTASGKYDTVMTAIETKGSENVARNQGKTGYDIGAILGLKTAGIADVMGYSTFDLCEPAAGTYPLEDPTIPSLAATPVAIHEWMHQLEYIGDVLDIEYPYTHAYNGEYSGYQKYIFGENNYDYCEFYELVLGGKLPYTGNGSVEYVGMYPKMWKLIKRNVLNLGTYTFKSVADNSYLTGQTSAPTLTKSANTCNWLIRYAANGNYVLIPENIPTKRIDLNNAWDKEGNTVNLWTYTSYVDAQSWKLTKNVDGTYCIRTAKSSGRAITIASAGAQALLKTATSPTTTQKWIINQVNATIVTPTVKPTATPTVKPTATPTVKPTATPTVKPTATPTVKPTATPTVKPTATPTVKPTATPTPAITTTTVYYANSSWSQAYIHYKVGNGSWTTVPGVKMQNSSAVDGYTWKYIIDLGQATGATLCFNNGNGSWDNNNGNDYSLDAGTYGIKNGSKEKLVEGLNVSVEIVGSRGSSSAHATVANGVAPYTYSYVCTQNGTNILEATNTSTLTSDSRTFRSYDGGTYKVDVVVTDAEGKTGKATATRELLPLYIADINASVASPQKTGTTVTFTADIQSEFYYKSPNYRSFSISKDGKTYATEYSASNYITYTFEEEGTYDITCTLTDASSQTATKTIQFVVSDATNVATIYYNTGWTNPHIHYCIAGGSWTAVPGVSMTKTTEKAGYTYKAVIDLGEAKSITVCFNNGNGSWDSKNGANYSINKPGVFGVSNGVVYDLQ